LVALRLIVHEAVPEVGCGKITAGEQPVAEGIVAPAGPVNDQLSLLQGTNAALGEVAIPDSVIPRPPVKVAPWLGEAILTVSGLVHKDAGSGNAEKPRSALKRFTFVEASGPQLKRFQDSWSQNGQIPKVATRSTLPPPELSCRSPRVEPFRVMAHVVASVLRTHFA
jgi:hypothetical protein